MVAKVEIVERLEESAILLPDLIAEGLQASDRLKIRLTLLQEAAAQATTPGRPPPSMGRELESVGLDDPVFVSFLSGARKIDADHRGPARGGDRATMARARALTGASRDVRVGVMIADDPAGLANGCHATQTVNPTAGVRIRF